MVKKQRGRKPIQIIESVPYSQIVFLIASGINYPEAISKARQTDSSSTVKQLDTLRKSKFLQEPKKEKLLNKTVYSVNWNKISNNFIDYVFNKFERSYNEIIRTEEESSEEIKKQLQMLFEGRDKGEVGKTRYPRYNKYYNRIKDKTFEKVIRENEYIKYMLKITFSFIGRVLTERTIKETFEDLRLALSSTKEIFDGVYHPTPEFDNVTQKEVDEFVKKVLEEHKKDKKYIQLEEFIKIAKGIIDLNAIQGTYRLKNYLQIKYSLLSCSNNKITKDSIQEDRNNEEIRSISQDNSNLRTLIGKLKEDNKV